MVDTPRWRFASDFVPPLATDRDVYRRRIAVQSVDRATVVADLEDDFHHFVVTLRHDGTKVVGVANQSHRWPWATCPGAAEHLRSLVGMALSNRFTAAARHADPKANCTHQFDAAAHAITHAAWKRDYRQYDAEIGALLRVGGSRPNRLWVDGRLALEWEVRPGVGPAALDPPYAGAPWRGGFMRWADSHLDPETAETAITLRRACDIGMGRGMALDAVPVAADLPSSMAGVCHSMQPDVAPGAFRNVGSIRDHAAHPELLGTDPAIPRRAVLAR